MRCICHRIADKTPVFEIFFFRPVVHDDFQLCRQTSPKRVEELCSVERRQFSPLPLTPWGHGEAVRRAAQTPSRKAGCPLRIHVVAPHLTCITARVFDLYARLLLPVALFL